MTKKKQSIFTSQKFIVLLVVIGLMIVFSLISKDFRKYTTLLSMLDYSYYDVLMAIGVAFPLITGGVDLSIGTGMVCYALAGGYLIRFHSWPVGAAILVSILFGCAIGLLNGVLIAIMDLPPFLATLCTCMITRGLGSICSGSFGIPWPIANADNGWFHSIFKITLASGTKIPLGFLWMVLLALLMAFVLGHTKFGRYVIAIGSNKEATILSGINVKFYHVMAYVVCGLFAGLASISYANAIPTVQPGTGAGMELDAIGGAIVGGVSATGGYGTIIGTLLGTYVICLLKTGLPYIGLQANWQQIITGLVLIGAVLIDILKKERIKK
ncbi:MAG: ABC transporter permease [Lachnospiraceae bacterium]|nr:ABC transporter permease [Lachnospiraceae bacterium]